MDVLATILVIGSGLISIFIGIGLAKFSEKLKERNLKKKGEKFLEGKEYNIINIEGERIHIHKFNWKNPEGEVQSVEIPLNMVKSSQNA